MPVRLIIRCVTELSKSARSPTLSDTEARVSAISFQHSIKSCGPPWEWTLQLLSGTCVLWPRFAAAAGLFGVRGILIPQRLLLLRRGTQPSRCLHTSVCLICINTLLLVWNSFVHATQLVPKIGGPPAVKLGRTRRERDLFCENSDHCGNNATQEEAQDFVCRGQPQSTYRNCGAPNSSHPPLPGDLKTLSKDNEVTDVSHKLTVHMFRAQRTDGEQCIIGRRLPFVLVSNSFHLLVQRWDPYSIPAVHLVAYRRGAMFGSSGRFNHVATKYRSLVCNSASTKPSLVFHLQGRVSQDKFPFVMEGGVHRLRSMVDIDRHVWSPNLHALQLFLCVAQWNPRKWASVARPSCEGRLVSISVSWTHKTRPWWTVVVVCSRTPCVGRRQLRTFPPVES